MRRQLPSVSGAQCLKPRPPVAPQRGVVGDALREQKPLDPVHMRDALLDQCPPFAAKPPPILFLGRGRNHHRADPRLPAPLGAEPPAPRPPPTPRRPPAPPAPRPLTPRAPPLP